MTKDPMQRYAESLEKTIQQNYNQLKEAVEEFKTLCLLVTPEKNTPPEILVDIRELYKEIRDRFSEIKAIQQILRGKYRQYYRRDSLREKGIMEFGFLTKNLHSKVEYILMQKQALSQKREASLHHPEQKGFPSHWFRLKENQVGFVRNLRVLDELDYNPPSDPKIEERREVVQERVRLLTLFCFKGEPRAIEGLLTRIRLREHDLIERYTRDELRGVFAHLREIPKAEMEALFQRILKTEEFKNLKCLYLILPSGKDLQPRLIDSMRKALEEMKEGEMRSLLV